MTKLRILTVMLCMTVLAACGQTTPPSAHDIQDNVEYFDLIRPDGTTMECVKYGSSTAFTQESKSWFSFTCDWSSRGR